VSLTLRKGGVAKMKKNEMVSSAEVLVTVVVCAALVVPMVTLPKLSCSGFTCSCSPVSFSNCAKVRLGAARPNAKRRKKLRTENVKMDNFDRDMVIPPMNSAATNVYESAPITFPPQAKFSDFGQLGTRPDLARVPI
jgi:hypothetical protein